MTGMHKGKSVLALVLLVPAPSLGALAGMVLFPGTLLGKCLFAASKVWLCAFPLVWLTCVDGGRFSLSPVRKGGWLTGLATGAAISALILMAYLVFGQGLFDRAFFIAKMRAMGIAAWPVYLGAAAYWILVNSVLEEYVWRWFVYQKCAALLKPAAAVILSAACFTLHHVLALQVYFSLPLVIICSLGAFVGGVIWSAMYSRYESIWPGYLSHALVDLTIFGLGAYMLYG